jgi:hypothetical protein
LLIQRLISFVGLAAITAATPAECPVKVQDRYSAAVFVVLARVTESSFPTAATTREDKLAAFSATATLTVTRSWKGVFAAGSTVSAGPPEFATGVWPEPHLFHVGDEVLVFADGRYTDLARPHDFLSWSNECWVINKANASKEMAILDSLGVK